MNTAAVIDIPAGLSISALERDIGIGKETLRVWERRYGFPMPERDALGERVYPAEQVARLRLVKRLIDRGGRPGKLLVQPIEALQGQLAATMSDNAVADWLIPLLKQREVARLRAELAQRLGREGLERFALDTVPALNARIGDGWMNGEIEVFEEHLYTEQVQNLLRSAIQSLGGRGARPRVLLTTVKDEEHVLGLLLAEAVLSVHGASCVSLGTQTPVADIVGAASATAADIVALSFSAACPWRKAADALTRLRAALPGDISLWAGGAGVAGRAKRLPGIVLIAGLDGLAPALAGWRGERGPTSG